MDRIFGTPFAFSRALPPRGKFGRPAKTQGFRAPGDSPDAILALEDVVNTESRNHLAEMVHLRNGATPLAPSPHSADTDSLTPSSPDSATARRLRDFMTEGAELLPLLEEQLDTLQETFVSLLERQFEKEKFTPGHRLHIFLSQDGKLVVEGEDDDADKVCALFARQPRLHERFRELARLALLTHGIAVARRAHAAMETGADSDEEPLLGRYHMCLKGALSHFYVR